MAKEDSMITKIDNLLADSDTIEALFKVFLNRNINNAEFKDENNNKHSIVYWIDRLLNSEEFTRRVLLRTGAAVPPKDLISNATYRTPRLRGPYLPSKIIITGSCLTEAWLPTLREHFADLEIRHVIFNNASELEDLSAVELRSVDFQVAQIPLRSVIADADYFSRMDGVIGRQEDLFEECAYKLRMNFEALMKYKRNSGIPVFLLNFAVPQANPLGHLMPRYDLSNYVYFVERLNIELSRLIVEEGGVFLIDFDAICGSIGKRYILDDLTSHSNHGSFLGGTHWEEDIALTPYGSIADIYAPKIRDAILAIFNECLAAYHVVSPTEKVKLVIFDLDGTLWRGVPAESDNIAAHRISEGWPLSIVEAASMLKRRGIVLAIASKNNRETAERIWSLVYGAKFPLDNFASVKISWGSKVDSVQEILQDTNILPENSLFVDDNPIEREQILRAFPGISVITGPIITWKRQLLWSPELQVPFVTDEGKNRTKSIQNITQREALKNKLSHDDFIMSLDVKILFEEINSVESNHFKRAHELINKTNQFNTTGRRWTERELLQYFQEGGCAIVAHVSDRLSGYGLTALLLRQHGECTQIVMSCRVFGLRVEYALFDLFLSQSPMNRSIICCETGKNGLCRNFYQCIGLSVPETLPMAPTAHSTSIASDFTLPIDLSAGSAKMTTYE